MSTVPTTTRTRKPRSKPARRVQIGTACNGVFALHMVIGEGEKKKHYGYYVSRIPADFGRGFHFEKFSTEQVEGEESAYDVNIDPDGFHSCECKGFQRWNHCKHVESVLALVQTGKL